MGETVHPFAVGTSGHFASIA